MGVLGTGVSIGVKGTSVTGFALHGTSSGSGVGLYARSESGTGVLAEATSGNAIYAEAVDLSYVTVDAVHTEGGYALRSQGQTHLVGDAKFSNRLYGEGANAKFEGNGAGLTALRANSIATGTLADARLSPNIPRLSGPSAPFAGKVSAVQFTGPAGSPPVFPGAGTAAVPAGRNGVTVSTPGVGANGHVLALFQSNPGAGVSVKHIEKVAGGFRAVFTAPTKRSTTLAYFVVGQA